LVEFNFVAFNAHWGAGRFGPFRRRRFDVARIITDLDADIVVLPESWRSDDGRGLLDPLRDEGYQVETVEMMRLAMRKRTRDAARDAVPREGVWELAVASRLPVLERRTYPIGRIPADPPGQRSALALTVDIGGTPVEVIGLHTSSKVWKLAPVRHLLTLRRQLPRGGPQILAGDFNFWGPPVGALMRGWKRPVRGRTYPSPRPHSQIDHILVRGGIEGVEGEVLPETPSDHRPIRARLRVANGVS
jgi:endonuclease/exonuclease/phosphatase family metal-dependent hydrolase